MIVVFLFIAFAIFIFIFVNVFIYKNIVRKAVKDYLQPYFKSKGLLIYKIKSIGILHTGDFDEKFFTIVPVPKNGKIFNNTFTDVYVKDASGIEYKYTIRIKTFFLKIQKVILKSKKEQIEIELPRCG